MPYLTHDAKERLIEHMYPETGGELNYLITTMMLRYWIKSKRRYEDINTVMGAAESAKQEFYRRVAVPYEAVKIRENGDVYPEELRL